MKLRHRLRPILQCALSVCVLLLGVFGAGQLTKHSGSAGHIISYPVTLPASTLQDSPFSEGALLPAPERTSLKLACATSVSRLDRERGGRIAPTALHRSQLSAYGTERLRYAVDFNTRPWGCDGAISTTVPPPLHA